MSGARAPRRIGVYGGSFDPVHVGHLGPVEEVRARLSLDSILFVPAFSPPHKPAGPSASSHHRFAMLALALADHPRFLLSDFEVARGGTTYTVETLRHMRAVYEDAEIVLVIGSDALASFETWRSWKEILSSHRVAVVHREPFDYARTVAALSADARAFLAPEGAAFGDVAPSEGGPVPSVFWGGNAPVTISSTWLRRAIPEGENLNGGLPSAVATYVRKQGLYLTP